MHNINNFVWIRNKTQIPPPPTSDDIPKKTDNNNNNNTQLLPKHRMATFYTVHFFNEFEALCMVYIIYVTRYSKKYLRPLAISYGLGINTIQS